MAIGTWHFSMLYFHRMERLVPALQQQVNRAIVILKRGGIVAYPTDTVYGLGAVMTSLSGVERIFEVKGRPKGMALPLLVADAEQIRQVAFSIPDAAWRLVEEFMPGALTIVLLRASSVPDVVTGGGGTIAIRIPNHPVPLSLIAGTGKPIVGTSANLSGHPSALTADEVRAQIGDKVDLIIDGGRCPGGIESTVVDFTLNPPVMRRPGAIPLELLKQVIPEIALAEEVTDAHRRG